MGWRSWCFGPVFVRLALGPGSLSVVSFVVHSVPFSAYILFHFLYSFQYVYKLNTTIFLFGISPSHHSVRPSFSLRVRSLWFKHRPEFSEYRHRRQNKHSKMKKHEKNHEINSVSLQEIFCLKHDWNKRAHWNGKRHRSLDPAPKYFEWNESPKGTEYDFIRVIF